MTDFTEFQYSVSQFHQQLLRGRGFDKLDDAFLDLRESQPVLSRTILKPTENDDEVLELLGQFTQRVSADDLSPMTDEQFKLLLTQIGSIYPELRDRGTYAYFDVAISAGILTDFQIEYLVNYLLADERLFSHIAERLMMGFI